MAFEVVVAGTGIAASAVASRLIDAGCKVSLLRRRTPYFPGAEILPPEARAQVEALGWENVLDNAGVVIVEGFENHWNRDEPIVKPGPFLHVERTAMARSALAFVTKRGATVHDVQRLPALKIQDAEYVHLNLDGGVRRFHAAIDATGRSAAWSRPVRRQGRQVADIFAGTPGSTPMRGRVVVDRARELWAYRAGVVKSTTIGAVTLGPARRELDPALAGALGVSAGTYRFIGRRPSFLQWAAEPVVGRRLAIGDAAFASDPLAGQGLRFAMASALAAAAAVDALVRSNCSTLGLEYYRDFVTSARNRHQSALSDLHTGPASPAHAIRVPDILRFTARPRLAALNVGGALVADTAYELPDGGLVRWIGGFDLRRLARLAHEPVTSHELFTRLRAEGLSAIDTQLLIIFCLSRDILG
jgi:2-polyprenyl-6-methoxyphenol hydroxylase-like FAD-dependent oxidoreductase